MDLITKEPASIISQLLIPVIITILAGIIPAITIKYFSLREKNQYIKFLKMNFLPINEFMFQMGNYKTFKFFGAFVSLFLGFLIGIFIGVGVGISVFRIVDYIINSNYFQTHAPIENHNLFVINSVMFLIFISYLISTGVTLLLGICGSKFNKSKNLNNSKLAEHGEIKISIYLLYFYSWLLIGIALGVNINHYMVLLNFFNNVLAFYHFNFPVSWSWNSLEKASKFINSRVENLDFYFLFYSILAIINFFFICLSWYIGTEYSNSIVKLIKNSYKYDFPYIKIKTESGEVKGQLTDIQNKSLVTLSEKNVYGVVPWDKIEIMEVFNSSKNEYFVFDNGSITSPPPSTQ